jgi:translation initiation factor eIF-2B subunit gamma
MRGCIVGRRARIEGLKAVAETAEGEKGSRKKKGGDDEDERTKLTDCEIAPGFVVEAGTEAKGEKMMGFDTEEDGEGFGDEEDEEDVEDDE